MLSAVSDITPLTMVHAVGEIAYRRVRKGTTPWVKLHIAVFQIHGAVD